MRISGVNIPDNKKALIALTYIRGIGRSSAKNILSEAKVDTSKRARELTSQEVNKIQLIINKSYSIEGELRQRIRQNISRLKAIGSYRGIRHDRKLPVRGQRTKSNSRTVRGNIRRTAGSGKRKVELK